MRKLIFNAFLFILPLGAFAESKVISGFRGLHDSDAAILIGDSEAQDLSNVDITDSGNGVKKRSGYALFKTFGVSTAGVTGGYYFRDAAGNDDLISANNGSVYYSRSGGNYTAFITTDTPGAYYDFTDSNGSLWRADSAHDQIAKWNGTTLTYFPNHPKGDQVEVLPDRLVVSGVTSSPNTVYFSGSADFTNFESGTEEISPFTENFGLPGQNVTAIKTMCGGLGVWTKNTLSLWTGTNQFDGQIVPVAPNIGTTQPGTILQDGGVTFWQAQDNRFFSFDCNSVSDISRKIDFSGFAGGDSKSITQSEQTDFQSGTFVNTSSAVIPGAVALNNSSTTIDSFTDGNYTASPVWTPTVYSGVGSWSAATTQLVLTSPSGVINSARVHTPVSISNPVMVSAKMTASGGLESGSGGFDFGIGLMPTDPPVSGFGLTDGYFVARDFSGNLIIRKYVEFSASDIASTPYSFSLGTQYTIGLSVNNGVVSALVDGVVITSATDSTFNNFAYLVLLGSVRSSPASTRSFDDVAVQTQYSTGTFISSPINIGTNITSWGNFVAEDSSDGGTIGYFIRSTTTENGLTSTAWTSITSGAQISVATSSWVQIKSSFTITSMFQNPAMLGFTLNWNEGNFVRSFGAIDKDHRLLWSVATGTATVPNTTYIYDQRFDSWLKYTLPFIAPSSVGYKLYFGSPSSGSIYYWPSGNTDAGNPFTSYWKSKDFPSGDPFTEKDFVRYSFVGKAYAGSNLDFTYNIDDTGDTTVNFSLTDPLSSVTRKFNDYFPSGTNGSLINFKFGNDDADAPFEVHAFGYEYTPRPWRVMQ